MLPNRHYELNGSSLTANRTYKLPTGNVGDKIRVSLLSGNNTYALILQGDTGITINGGSAATEWSRLFIAREYVEFRATSSSNWDVWDDGRISQLAEMSVASTATNVLPNATYTKIPLDTVNIDNAGVASTVNDQFTVRRAGNYTTEFDVLVGGLSSVATNFLTTVFGTARLFGIDEDSTPSGAARLLTARRELALATGGTVYFEVYHTNGGSRNVGTLTRVRLRELL
jgi:hypothetical protein